MQNASLQSWGTFAAGCEYGAQRLIRVKAFKWGVSWEKGPTFLPCVVLHLARSLASRTAGGPRFSNMQQLPCWLVALWVRGLGVLLARSEGSEAEL